MAASCWVEFEIIHLTDSLLLHQPTQIWRPTRSAGRVRNKYMATAQQSNSFVVIFYLPATSSFFPSRSSQEFVTDIYFFVIKLVSPTYLDPDFKVHFSGRRANEHDFPNNTFSGLGFRWCWFAACVFLLRFGFICSSFFICFLCLETTHQVVLQRNDCLAFSSNLMLVPPRRANSCWRQKTPPRSRTECPSRFLSHRWLESVF